MPEAPTAPPTPISTQKTFNRLNLSANEQVQEAAEFFANVIKRRNRLQTMQKAISQSIHKHNEFIVCFDAVSTRPEFENRLSELSKLITETAAVVHKHILECDTGTTFISNEHGEVNNVRGNKMIVRFADNQPDQSYA